MPTNEGRWLEGLNEWGERDRLNPDDCNECNRDVPEDDAGPSCGAHVLHVDCAPWFGCHECYLMRAEIP